MLLVSGDISNRSLSCASAYGEITYISNSSTADSKAMNPMLDKAQWQTHLEAYFTKYYGEGTWFRVCIVSLSSSIVVALQCDPKEPPPPTHPPHPT